jgi:predicted phage-related endonuclease
MRRISNECFISVMLFRYDELKLDFEEYQEDSKTLEQELDTQLKQLELKNKDLTACVSRLQNDNENLRVRRMQELRCSP